MLKNTVSQLLAGALPPAGHRQTLGSGVTVIWGEEGVVTLEPACPPQGAVLLSVGVHGNETAPIEALDRLLNQLAEDAWPLRVRLCCVFGNPDAMRAGVRYLDDDLNRCFGAPLAQHSRETARAEVIRAATQSFFAETPADLPRLHYDLHTAIRGSQIEKFAICPFRPDGSPPPLRELNRLAAAGIAAILHHAAPSSTFSYFSLSQCHAESFTLELGRARPFGQNQSVHLGALEQVLQQIGQGLPPAPPFLVPPRFAIVQEVIKRSEAFRLYLDEAVENFTPLALGMLLAEDGPHQTVITHQNARIIFPNPKVKNGLRAGLVIAPLEGERPRCG